MTSASSATNTTPPSNEHVEMLATKWWAGDQFQLHDISCRKGQFTCAETECVQDMLNQYRAAAGISQEDLKDLVLGLAKWDGFWENIARAVPGRHVHSVLDHAQRLYNPYRDKGDWTNKEDLRLKILVNEHLNWKEISTGMEHSAATCHNRYHRHMVHHDTRCKGAWSEEEVTRLTQVIQAMEEEGKTPNNTPKFWKTVSECLDRAQTRDQCRDKWIAKSSGRNRWRDTDAKALIKKIAHLNLDHENDIRWAELIDEHWNTWTAEQLRGKWYTLKAKVKVDGSAMHHDIVQQLMDHGGMSS
ncbi:hypothetical protein V8E53_004648 [Lactarius tabidus]